MQSWWYSWLIEASCHWRAQTAVSVVHDAMKSYNGLDVLCLNSGIMAYNDIEGLNLQTKRLSLFLLASLVYSSVKCALENQGESRELYYTLCWFKRKSKHIGREVFYQVQGGDSEG